MRYGSTKRVASVGEGAMPIQLIHQYLRQLADVDAQSFAAVPEGGPERVAIA